MCGDEQVAGAGCAPRPARRCCVPLAGPNGIDTSRRDGGLDREIQGEAGRRGRGGALCDRSAVRALRQPSACAAAGNSGQQRLEPDNNAWESSWRPPGMSPGFLKFHARPH